MPEEKPQPYAFCEAHFKANCPLCKPVPVAALADETLPPPEPQYTDPAAVNVMAVATKFAKAIDTQATLERQIADCRAKLEELEKQRAANEKVVAMAGVKFREAV